MAPSRRFVSGVLAAVVAVPLALTMTGSGRAAPTLTLPEAEAQLAALQTQEDAAVEAYDAGRIQSAAASQAADQAQAAVSAQTTRLHRMQAGIASFAVSTYEGGAPDPVQELLSGGNPNDAVARAGMLDQIAGVHAQQLTAIEAQQVVLRDSQTAATQKSAAADAALKTVADKKTAIDKLVAQQQQVVDSLQEQVRQQLLAQQAAERAAAAAAAKAALLAQQQAAARVQTVRVAAAPVTRSAPVASAPVASAPVQTTAGSGSSSAGVAAMHAAETQMGKPYGYGAAGPNAYDCSGLTMWAFAQAGVSLPHSAAGQMGYGTPVSLNALQPGDLVFYDEGGTIGHVGIYVGNGQMIDANHTGGWVGIRGLYSGLAGARRL